MGRTGEAVCCPGPAGICVPGVLTVPKGGSQAALLCRLPLPLLFSFVLLVLLR